MHNEVLMVVLMLSSFVASAAGTRELAKNFVTPPDAARPWVYWFPLDGNISSNGITADLEAMKRAGIGGVLYMETDQGAPKGPARFAGPLWRNLFKHICAEANRLGLEVNMNNDAGWCGSGGPWITPELSMQHLVWTETNVVGPRHFEAILPPPKATGNFYRDIAVFAFPTPASNYVIPHLRGKSADTKEEIPLRAVFPSLPATAIIGRHRITNLTARLRANGGLTWDIPEGKWTLLRLGHTSTGKDNHPAPLEGRGLECDKLNKEAAEAMFAGLMAKLVADSRPLAGKGKTLVSTHIDSWEVGSQNWTPRFREEFQRWRGYDPLPLLPVMTGHAVDSLEISERFLWDVRQTVADLLLENYAGHFREMAHRNGLRLSIEAYDGDPADDMAYAGRADEPMAEFWSWARFGAAYSCTEMSSAAHIYGKRILGAEAFTATDQEKWLGHPALVKDLGDWAFCEGINRFVFHRFALQPWTNPNRPPGMSMGPWGLHYERTQTWWELSKAWHAYLARCQFMLQQGLFVADLCFLAPEMSPQRFKSPVKSGYDRPGYNFDGCTPEVVLTRMTVKGGKLLLPDGMSYRLLVLPQVETMTPRLLRKIKELVAAGATIAGPPPLKSPSLSGYPKCDDEVKQLAAELWGTGPAPSEITERPFGKGRLIWGGDLQSKSNPVLDTETSLAKAKWIWRQEGNPAQAAPPGKRFFRKAVNVDTRSGIDSAWLTMTADNSFDCWINGKHAGSGDQFNRSYSMSLASSLQPGANLIAVAAVNATDSPNPAGLIGVLSLKYRDGRTQEIPTDRTWEAATTAMGNWTTDTHSTEGWVAAMELGPLGMPPWGDIEPSSPSSDPTPDINIFCRLLAKMGVPPDFRSRTAASTQSLRYIHKTIGKTDVYFVANKNPQPEEAACAFRIQGRRPELWYPDTGRIERPAVYDQKEGFVCVPIRIEPNGSVFVVFRSESETEPDRVTSIWKNGQLIEGTGWTDVKEPPDDNKVGITNDFAMAVRVKPEADIELVRENRGSIQAIVSQPGTYVLRTANGKSRQLEVATVPPPLEITGPWEVRFDPKWGGPESVIFNKLDDWSKRSEDGIRYYSGTALYRKVITVPPIVSGKRCRVFLDLGKVAVMAEVKLNGKNLGILWKPPFRVDVTDALNSGDNVLELKVVNLWINRQIGDEQLPEDSNRNANGTLKEWPLWIEEGKPSSTGRFTFTSWRLWKKGDPLVESGLLGPVMLQSAERIVVQDH